MRGIDHALASRNLFNFIYENRAFFRQLIHHKSVVDNFATHINGRAEGVEGDLDNVNGADHTGAEAAGFEQQDTLLAGETIGAAKVGDGFFG